MRILAVVMLVLAAAGVAVHLVLLLLRPAMGDLIRQYFLSRGMHIALALAFANLFANYFHYRRTGMRVDILTRILTNVWIVCVMLLEWLNIRGG
jgi:hypothetical protein